MTAFRFMKRQDNDISALRKLSAEKAAAAAKLRELEINMEAANKLVAFIFDQSQEVAALGCWGFLLFTEHADSGRVYTRSLGPSVYSGVEFNERIMALTKKQLKAAGYNVRTVECNAGNCCKGKYHYEVSWHKVSLYERFKRWF